jgi:beta-lactamase regulating signal transducer with metallopeptidase domain
MMPALQTLAEITIGRALNSVPEGLLIALFAWMLLRLLPRQNGGTRFAVWFLALLAVAGLPWLAWPARGGFAGNSLLAVRSHPLITLHDSWAMLVFVLWVVAAAVALLRLGLGFWNLRKLRAGSVAVDPTELDPVVRRTFEEFHASRPVVLATSEDARVPAALGFWKPMIVLPAWTLRELPAGELNAILLHEFAHLRRWDDWTNLLQKIVRAVFFFHPAVWWIERRLSLEREMACDDAVLAQTGNPRGYAQCLIALLEKSFARRGLQMAQATVDRTREALTRVARILDHQRPSTTRVWKPALGLVGAFSAICLIALPHTPQLVAVETRITPTNTTFAHAAGRQVAFHSAMVIPAVLRASDGSSGSGSLPRTPTQVVKPRRAVPQSVAAGMKGASGAAVPPIVMANHSDQATKALVPQMLILIETRQEVSADSWMWSLRVWRLTVVTPAPARVPPAKST